MDSHRKSQLLDLITRNHLASFIRQIKSQPIIFCVLQETDFHSIYDEIPEFGPWICYNYNVYLKKTTSIAKKLLSTYLKENDLDQLQSIDANFFVDVRLKYMPYFSYNISNSQTTNLL